MKRGLLFVAIVLLAVLAWPAMTPGLFSGQAVGDAWRMAAETTRKLIYAPALRQGWSRVRGLPAELALKIPAAREVFADAVPQFQRRARPVYERLASIDLDDEVWWDPPPDWRFIPFYPHRRHRRHHHHHHPHPPPVVSAVPEPATWLLMIGGFGMVGFALRRARPAPAPGEPSRAAGI